MTDADLAEAARMMRAVLGQCEKYDCEMVCYYCDAAVLPRRHEHDHFPTPRWLGGTRVVTACLRCHDLKDRIPFGDWSTVMAMDALTATAAVVGEPTADPARIVKAYGDAEARWHELTVTERVFYAKMCARVAEEAVLYPTTLF